MSLPHSEPRAFAAARVTLFALRATLVHPEQVVLPAYLMLPDRTPLTDGYAAARLANLPKPLACAAFPALGMMAIGCWLYHTAAEPRPDHGSVARDVLDSVARQYAPNENSRFLLRAAGDELLVAWTELQNWFSSYSLILGGYVFDGADAAARERGAVATLTFRHLGGGSPVTMYDV